VEKGLLKKEQKERSGLANIQKAKGTWGVLNKRAELTVATS